MATKRHKPGRSSRSYGRRQEPFRPRRKWDTARPNPSWQANVAVVLDMTVAKAEVQSKMTIWQIQAFTLSNRKIRED